jgi:hypothetical protein
MQFFLCHFTSDSGDSSLRFGMTIYHFMLMGKEVAIRKLFVLFDIFLRIASSFSLYHKLMVSSRAPARDLQITLPFTLS